MKKGLLFLLLSIAAVACTTETYEKGDGENSYLQADFVDAHADANLKIDYVDTDGGERLNISVPFTKSFVKKAESSYRAILYYNKKGDNVAEMVSFAEVGVAGITPIDSLTKKTSMKTDPLTLEGLWVSKNKRYLNATLYVKIGSTDDNSAMHRLAVISDTLMSHTDGKKTLHLRLYHDQGGMPEYYSQRTYFSIPIQKLGVDSIQFTINTYKGLVTKTLSLK